MNALIFARSMLVLVIAWLPSLGTGAGQSDLRVVYSNEFQTVVGPEWSSRNTRKTPNGARVFLGEFGSQTVTLTLKDLPPHSEAIVAFDLFLIRTWDGNSEFEGGPDLWAFSVDDRPPLLETTFNNVTPPYFNGTQPQAFPGNYPHHTFPPYTGAAEKGTLGFNWNGIQWNAVYRLRFHFEHQSDRMLLKFAGIGLQQIADESWGLDNIMVSVGRGEGSGPPTFVFQPENQIGTVADPTVFSAKARGKKLRYQWLFAGEPLDGQTNSFLVLTNLTPAAVGPYAVETQGPNGKVRSAPATLGLIKADPPQRTATLADHTSFFARAWGTIPSAYQWFKDNQELPGETGEVLKLSGVSLADAGAYSVQVTTPQGEVRSSPSKLLVTSIPPTAAKRRENEADIRSDPKTDTDKPPLAPQRELNSIPNGDYLVNLEWWGAKQSVTVTVKDHQAEFVKTSNPEMTGMRGKFERSADGTFYILFQNEQHNAGQLWRMQPDGTAVIKEIPDRGENQRATPIKSTGRSF